MPPAHRDRPTQVPATVEYGPPPHAEPVAVCDGGSHGGITSACSASHRHVTPCPGLRPGSRPGLAGWSADIGRCHAADTAHHDDGVAGTIAAPYGARARRHQAPHPVSGDVAGPRRIGRTEMDHEHDTLDPHDHPHDDALAARDPLLAADATAEDRP